MMMEMNCFTEWWAEQSALKFNQFLKRYGPVT